MITDFIRPRVAGHGHAQLNSHLALCFARRHAHCVDQRDVQTIMAGLFQANWKLDRILEYIGGDDEEEEDEANSS